jgi:hypothetical protein
MTVRHPVEEFTSSLDVSREVQDRERDGRRLLHAEKSPEWPFPKVLLHPDAFVLVFICDMVRANVSAVVGACPSREAEGPGEDSS